MRLVPGWLYRKSTKQCYSEPACFFCETSEILKLIRFAIRWKILGIPGEKKQE